MKLALVHDWLKEIGGAERVLIELHKLFPEAPIYVLFYDKKFIQEWLPGARVKASFLQKIPFISKVYPLFGWLMPAAIESFDLSEFDRVLSSSVTFSKGLVLKPATKHICYCYSPTRYLWDWHSEYAKKKSWLGKLFQHLLRMWDRLAADRVDEFIAISKTVQSRIKKYYHCNSIVIYPPVRKLQSSFHSDPRRKSADFRALPSAYPASTVALEKNSSGTDYYLIVSRLFPHKNIDVAIQAFNKLRYPLVIIGDGPSRGSLRSKAGKNIVFVSKVPDSELGGYYNHCRALIMPQEEDFGLTPIEAMNFGKPVVALRRGGATETIEEGVSGEFFDDPIPEALADAVRRLNERYAVYKPEVIKAQAEKFSPEAFQRSITEVLR